MSNMGKRPYVSALVILVFVVSSFSAPAAHALFGFNTCEFEEPTNGNLNLGDDDFADVSGLLPEGWSFTFWGKQYGPGKPGIFVGSNGYITFGEGDDNFSESFTDLCLIPRIAGLFDDFNPNAGGAVKAEFKSFPPRLIVTWDDVPEFNSGNSNTFQVILFVGTNKYHISYNGVDATDGMVGVCKGRPPAADFSASTLAVGNNMGVLYEEFNGGSSFDLDGECLRGKPVLFPNSIPVIER